MAMMMMMMIAAAAAATTTTTVLMRAGLFCKDCVDNSEYINKYTRYPTPSCMFEGNCPKIISKYYKNFHIREISV
jgi:hypothetical protein